MKTYLLYGFIMALAGAVFMVVLYLLGFHSDPERLKLAQMLGMAGGLAISAVCLWLGIKARREQVPASEEFGYGSAFAAGFMIGLFGALFGIVTTILYGTVINPEFADVVVQAQVREMEARGLNATQIEAVEKMTRTMTRPWVQAVFAFVFGTVFNTVLSLLLAAFLKRSAAPVHAEAPPALG